jgi:hypothetical protein
MPKSAATLPAGVRITDKITLGQFAAVFSKEAVNIALDDCDRQSKRIRELPNELIVYFVMMLALFRDASHTEVLRCVTEALGWLFGRMTHKITGASGISKARSRVGFEPFKQLFDEFCVPLGSPGDKGAFYKKWRLTAIDGSLFDVDDNPANDCFGRSTNQNKRAGAYPQARLVSLMELGTHSFIAAVMGGYNDSEITLAKELVSSLKSDMLCIFDRLFYGYDLFKQASETGAAVLFRLKSDTKVFAQKRFPDGSFPATVYSSKDVKRQYPMTVRVIEYRVRGSSEIFRLMTNILDPEEALADDLAAIYHERWEFETALDELKIHLNARHLVLRSKTPSLVKQELYGMLMAHYVVRKTMFMASRQGKVDPDVLSFTHSVNVIRRKLPLVSSFPPEGFSPDDHR